MSDLSGVIRKQIQDVAVHRIGGPLFWFHMYTQVCAGYVFELNRQMTSIR